jgi:DNA polymerase (family 10)
MSNKEISSALKRLAALMELHEENAFKIKSLQNGAFQIDRFGSPIEGLSEAEILAIPGIGKGIAQKIHRMIQGETDEETDALLARTPVGLIALLSVKGLGPKKVRVLWKELEIESVGELLYACNENRLIELNGFGAKTQENIRQALEYALQNEGKLHYAEAELLANEAILHLRKVGLSGILEFTGELRRQNEVVTQIELIFAGDIAALKESEVLRKVDTSLIEFTLAETRKPIRVHVCSSAAFGTMQHRLTGPESHCTEIAAIGDFAKEEDVYTNAGKSYIHPALRDWSYEEVSNLASNKMLEMSDFKGILHCHSTYSDGIDSLQAMAKAAENMGMQYFGICDHSRSAGYAGGLPEQKVLEQHAEIHNLNAANLNFKIFKGIESDILVDGSLDYPEEILKQFDFIVASVHSVLRMDEAKATARLIRAIENPYTCILGHPSGRLLLSRRPYPIDYPKLIDACAANGVSIELNAHPYRLDLDWRWIPRCVEKGVKISINPDAHRIEGLHDIRYGTLVAQKAGLTADNVLNCLGRDGFEHWLAARKG